MYTKLVDACFIAGILSFGQCSDFLESLFSTLGTYNISGPSPEYRIAAHSAIMCGIICQEDDRCATFSFNETAKLCLISEGIVASGKVFGRKIDACPVDLGYQVYIRRKMKFCFKYHQGVSQSNAVSACGNDGARLLTIEDEKMFNFVFDIMEDNNWDDVWLDAYDYDRDGLFHTSRGEPLPYVPTGSSLREGSSEYCLRMRKVESDFNDRVCHALYDALCQILV